MPRRPSSSTPAKRLAEVLAITAILMISITTLGKLFFDELDLEGPLPGIAITVFNLALAFVLLRWYHIRHAGSDIDGPPPLVPQAPRFTPAQQAYLDNPSARASCRHLQVVEGLIRQRNILIYPIHGSALRADCRLDEGALRSAVSLDGCVGYSEWMDERDRDGTLSCSACKSSITVRHPSIGGTIFPGP